MLLMSTECILCFCRRVYVRYLLCLKDINTYKSKFKNIVSKTNKNLFTYINIKLIIYQLTNANKSNIEYDSVFKTLDTEKHILCKIKYLNDTAGKIKMSKDKQYNPHTYYSREAGRL